MRPERERSVTLAVLERSVGWLAGVGALLVLGASLLGIWRGLHHPKGRATGLARRMLRLPAYILVGLGYFGACIVLWRPVSPLLSLPARRMALALGSLLCFPGLALVLWARLTLGEMYNVSSSLGAELYADHRLVTHGPFAIVRHPTYVGFLTAAVGGFLIYRTWTLVFVASTFLGLVVRARREEQALAAQFGEEWEAYHHRVPGWIPSFRRRAGAEAQPGKPHGPAS